MSKFGVLFILLFVGVVFISSQADAQNPEAQRIRAEIRRHAEAIRQLRQQLKSMGEVTEEGYSGEEGISTEAVAPALKGKPPLPVRLREKRQEHREMMKEKRHERREDLWERKNQKKEHLQEKKQDIKKRKIDKRREAPGRKVGPRKDKPGRKVGPATGKPAGGRGRKVGPAKAKPGGRGRR